MNPGLTSFRFFAFFAVFVFHSHHFRAGYLGVSAFFVLSGYLITAILVEMKGKFTGRDYFANFYARRSLRIFPVYYAYLLLVGLTAALLLQENMRPHYYLHEFFQQLPWALTYTYNFYMAGDTWQHNRLLSHFWSLAVEEQFYLVWPIAIYLLPVIHLRRFLLSIALLGLPIRWLLAHAVQTHGIAGLGPEVDLVVNVLPFSHLDAFAIGGYFALYVPTLEKRHVWLFGIFIALVGVLSSKLATDHYYWSGFGYDYFMKDSAKYVWGYTLFNVFFACVLVLIRNREFFPRYMESPVLVYLGTISYGLYVFHDSIIWSTEKLLPELPWIGKFIISLLLTVAISAISYRWLENPMIDLKERFYPKR